MKARKSAIVLSKQNFLISGKQLYHGGHAESIGSRPSMEDTCAVIGNFLGPNTQYYGLFDGHGGNNVSLYCLHNLHLEIAKNYKKPMHMEDAIKEALRTINKYAKSKWALEGSCAAIAIISKDIIYIANLGDSRVIVIDEGVAKRCTYDHKSSDPKERQMVIERGGHIANDRVNGILMLSRSIGDGILGKAVGSEPHLVKLKKKPGMKLILACDGVWDVMTDQEAADIVLNTEHLPDAARLIKDEALKRKSTDNVSCIVADLDSKAQ